MTQNDNRPPDPMGEYMDAQSAWEDAARKVQDMQQEPPPARNGPALIVLFALAVMVPLAVVLVGRYW